MGRKVKESAVQLELDLVQKEETPRAMMWKAYTTSSVAITTFNNGWTASGALSYIKLAEITSVPPEQDPLVKLYTLYIGKDQQLSLFAMGKKANSQMLGLPSKVILQNVEEVSEKFNNIEICHGLTEQRFIEHLQ